MQIHRYNTATFIPICDRCGGTLLSSGEIDQGYTISEITVIDERAFEYSKVMAKTQELVITQNGTVIKSLKCNHCGAIIDIIRIPFNVKKEESK